MKTWWVLCNPVNSAGLFPLGWVLNFCKNDFLRSTFMFLYYLNWDFLVIVNEFKTWNDSKAEKT